MNLKVLLFLFALVVVTVQGATYTPPEYPEGAFFTVKQDPNGV